MAWIFKISITCFAASYGVSFLLELSRLFFRAAVRNVVLVGFCLAGVLAHTLYLAARVSEELSRSSSAPLSSWYDFCLLASWIVATAYLVLVLRRPDNALGIFFVPLILCLIGLAVLFRDAAPFQPREALRWWRLIHGGALLVGTVAVSLGFATGLMYLVQAYRLKHKLPPRQGFRLPTLEWLQRFNGESLVVSTVALAVGLLSGVVLNLLSRARMGGVSWTDPVVLSSGILFAWLFCVTLFEWLYRPARQGLKMAYLTLASFLFLMLALSFVLVGEHAGDKRDSHREAVPAAEPAASSQPTAGTMKGSERVAWRSWSWRGGIGQTGFARVAGGGRRLAMRLTEGWFEATVVGPVFSAGSGVLSREGYGARRVDIDRWQVGGRPLAGGFRLVEPWERVASRWRSSGRVVGERDVFWCGGWG
jgi:ABC-type uncharacterized transport system permease subunit